MDEDTKTVEQEGLNTNEEKEETRNFSEKEVIELVQSETAKALAKQKKEFEKKYSLSQLDADQRAESEKDRRLAELEETVKNFTKIQNKNEVMKVLNARGLDAGFAEIVEIGDDIEEAQQRIETLDRLFKKAVAEEVKKRLTGGTAPKAGYDTAAVTKEDFAKMTTAQQAQLYNENPELYKKLTNK